MPTTCGSTSPSCCAARRWPTVDDPGVGEQFDGMIAYATSKGWLDESGTRVRAHIERA